MSVRRAPRGVIRVTGADAAAYLQGQISQDVEALAEGATAWSLVLDPGGKLIAWFRIWALADAYLFDTEPDAVDALVARLERFRLRTDVTFDVESGWLLESTLDGTADGELTTWFGWPGFSCSERLTTERLEAHVDDGWTEARLRAACPIMGIDIDDDTIPAEGGQPLIDLSVSFTKGCYTGQELVARIDSRGGNVPRPLRVVEADGPVEVGAAVTFEGQEIGTITSAIDNVGLGRLRRKAEVGAVVGVGDVSARISAPTA